MINYIEELMPGESFLYNNEYYLVTSDFKSNSKICYNLKNGFVRHFDNSTIISKVKLLTLDSENNIIAIKEDTSEVV